MPRRLVAPSMPNLRYYQDDAIIAVLDYFKQGNTGHPLVVLPTGAGKTHVLGGLCHRIHKMYPNEKVLILSHVKEILQQDYDTLTQYLPPYMVGIYSAGLNAKQVRPFTVASIQSVFKSDLFKEYRLVIVDEAHLIPPSGEGRYRTFFNNNPNSRIVGLTATPYRLGLGLLTEGLFDKIVYNKDIQELINEGYLCNLISKSTQQKMNTRDVRVTAGDFNLKDLSTQLDKTAITHKIIEELVKYKDERKHWLLFCIDIEHAEHTTAALQKAGISAACVHSRMEGDRTAIIELYKAQGFQALVCVETLTTGFDAPNIDLIALMRPTMSPVLHVQMIGRGLRLFSGKSNCLILDFAGNIARLGPINHIIPPPRAGVKKGTGKDSVPTIVCPECAEIVHASTKTCPCCGYKFPKTTKLMQYADDSPVLARTCQSYCRVDVKTIHYKAHVSKAGTLSLKVTYACGKTGLILVHEYIPIGSDKRAGYIARHWWTRRSSAVVPRSVQEALTLTHTLKEPKTLIIDVTDKYPRIKEFIW